MLRVFICLFVVVFLNIRMLNLKRELLREERKERRRNLEGGEMGEKRIKGGGD